MRPMKIAFSPFRQRGTNKRHNEDSLLLDGQLHQGSVREQGEVETVQPCYFAVTDGVTIGTPPRTAGRRPLELLQSRV